jgi:hypothetical protein
VVGPDPQLVSWLLEMAVSWSPTLKRDLPAGQSAGQESVVVTPLVLFNGLCSADDVALICRAAEEIESRQQRSPHLAFLGRPWVCNCYVLSGQSFFLAHWVHGQDVLRAHSAAELVQQMRSVAGNVR